MSNLLEGSILNGLFGCLVIWQTGSMIEGSCRGYHHSSCSPLLASRATLLARVAGRKGSMFLLHAVGTICLLSNLLFFVVMAAFQYLFKVLKVQAGCPCL